jgi:hypothetical protein
MSQFSNIDYKPNDTIIVKGKAYTVLSVKDNLIETKKGWVRVDEVERWSPF